MTPLPPYEHLELRPPTDDPVERDYSFLDEWDESPRNKSRRAVIGWLLISLAVVLLSVLAAALFLRGFGA